MPRAAEIAALLGRAFHLLNLRAFPRGPRLGVNLRHVPVERASAALPDVVDAPLPDGDGFRGVGQDTIDTFMRSWVPDGRW